MLYLERRQAKNKQTKKNPVETAGNSDLKNAWGTKQGDNLAFLKPIPERQFSQRCHSGNKGVDWCHFPLCLLKADIGCLTCLDQIPHPTLVGLPLSDKLASLPAWWASLPEDQHKPLPTPCLQTREF